jgi:hypothetical protein
MPINSKQTNSITPTIWEETMVLCFLKVVKEMPPADANIRLEAFLI